jgi:hypothetical protein
VSNAAPQEDEYAYLDRVLSKFYPEVDKRVQEQWNKRLSLQPKQQLAEDLAKEADTLLFGGAAGGGKSHWLLCHMARQMLEYPGNRGVIFRRVFPSLNRTIIPRARALFAGWGNYNKVEHTFYFDNGSILELATLQYEGDVDSYQGAEYGVIAFEEITEFTEEQVDYFKSRLRPPVEGPKPHMIATTNPGGIGHKWVKREWVRPLEGDVVEGKARPMEIWKARPKGAEPPMKRCFVPATLDDNPILTERDPRYRDRLRSIKDPRKRKAYEQGDWDAIEEIEGALWEYQALEEGRVHSLPTVNRRVMGIDPSDGDKESDGFGVTVGVLGEDNHGYIEWCEEWHQHPQKMAAKVIELYRDMHVDLIVIEKNHGGKWIPALLRTIDPTVNVDTVWASEGKRTRAEPVAALFHESDGFPALAHLVGVHPSLEDELTMYTGRPGEPSPDMLDSMVWCLTELMLDGDRSDPIPPQSNNPTIAGDLLTIKW